jgi:hypothetical protein
MSERTAVSPYFPFLPSFLLLYIPLYFLPSLSGSKLKFVCLWWLILMVGGEVRVWVTRSDLGRTRLLSQGVWQGLSLGGEWEKLGTTTPNTLSTGDIYWRNLQRLPKHTCTIGVWILTWTVTYMNYTLQFSLPNRLRVGRRLTSQTGWLTNSL